VLSAELVVLVAYLAVSAVIESNPIAQAVVGGSGREPGWGLRDWGLREWLVMLWLATVALFATGGAYRQRLNLSVWEEFPALAWRAALALIAMVALVDHLDGRAARDAVAILGAAGLGSHLAVRLGMFALLREARQSGRSGNRTLVLGGGTVSFKVVELLEAHPELGLLPLGYVDDLPAPLSQGPAGWTYLGQVEDLPGVVERLQIQVVVVGFGSGSDALAAQALRRLAGRDTPQAVFAVPRLFELGRRPIGQDHAGPIPLTRVRSASRRGPRWAAKRALDVAAAIVALLAVSPLLAVTALGVRWECGRGPVFVGHNHVGRRGATVRLWRFRTARPGRGPGPVGRRLRGSWLSRLPMLWNVLVGDLSLVGPRPVQPQESQRLQRMLPHYEHRLQVRGGLVGPGAAAPCPGDPPADEAVLYDTAYVENWGLWTDATVLLHGLRRLMGKGVPGVHT
jgi:lipopolysaccharide/colanic/teichoic acid biosynthesis glycosyltransferase